MDNESYPLGPFYILSLTHLSLPRLLNDIYSFFCLEWQRLLSLRNLSSYLSYFLILF